MKVIYTIGHSTHTIEEFVNLLKDHNIKVLVDVRTLPGSKYVPHFNIENMKKWLGENKITYVHMSQLGGLRKKCVCQQVEGWKNPSFKNYAAYSLSDEYEIAVKHLIATAKKEITCIMCAESVPWKCHRIIISNTLTYKGFKVVHIINHNTTIMHQLNKYGAQTQIIDGKITYPKTS